MVNLAVVLIAGLAIGQANPLKDDIRGGGQFAVDQRGKFVVYHVEPMPNKVNFTAVQEQFLSFLDAQGNQIIAKGTNRLESKGSLPMKRHVGIGNYVAGSVNYTLVVENKAGELNCWFTDLTYQPYRNDRYGKRVKATVSPIPLEQKFSAINAKVWEKQRIYAHSALSDVAEALTRQLEMVGRSKVITTSF